MPAAGDRLDAVAHRLGPGLGAEDARPQGQGLQVDAHARGALEDVEEVTRRAADGGDPEVLEDHDLALGIAAGGGDDGGADGLCAVVRAEAAGEQAVAVGVLHHVAPVHAAGGEGARHDARPDVDVRLGVGDHDRLARGTAGGVQAHDLAHVAGEEAEGIGVAQIGLDGEG